MGTRRRKAPGMRVREGAQNCPKNLTSHNASAASQHPRRALTKLNRLLLLPVEPELLPGNFFVLEAGDIGAVVGWEQPPTGPQLASTVMASNRDSPAGDMYAARVLSTYPVRNRIGNFGCRRIFTAGKPGLRWLREQDLNLRHSGYGPDELPGCSIPQYVRPAWLSQAAIRAPGTTATCLYCHE